MNVNLKRSYSANVDEIYSLKLRVLEEKRNDLAELRLRAEGIYEEIQRFKEEKDT